ncbi:MAG: von Willebrand factor type A domain-containing protein [Opitutus sp.]
MKPDILPDDPKLTAYALGELEGEELAEVERYLRTDPKARALVQKIRIVAAEVVTAFEDEATAAAKREIASDPYSVARRRRLLRFPHVAYILSGLAAAGLAVVLALEKPPSRITPKRYAAVPMALPSSDPEALEPSSVSDVTGDGSGPANSESIAPTMVVEGKNFDLRPLVMLDASKQVVQSPAKDVESLGAVPPLVFSFNYGDSRNWLAETERIQSLIDQKKAGTGTLAANNAKRVESDKRLVSGRQRAARTNLESDAALSVVNDEPIVLSPFLVKMAGPREIRSRSPFEALAILFGHGPKDDLAPRRDSEFVNVTDTSVSVFPVNVDTASYTNVRQMLMANQRPPAESVRVEEMINYFPYTYAAPKNRDVPFSATIEVAEAPWANGHRLVRIGLQGRALTTAERGAANLVFLLDVSKSMQEANKLPLLKDSLRRFVSQLRPTDRIAIVTYAGDSGLALPSTAAADQANIATALPELRVENSSDRATGIQLAYSVAQQNFVAGGVNRVILCTDGDFNFGFRENRGLTKFVEEKARTGVSLTVLGFGMGKMKDPVMQRLGTSGQGGYGYVGSERDAEKLLVQQVSGKIPAVARDVRVQVEFNPANVASYRLIGYEKLDPKSTQMVSGRVAAGELAAGHSVTALYEIIPQSVNDGAPRPAPRDQELRYISFASAPMAMRPPRRFADEVLTLKVRFKDATALLGKNVEYHLRNSVRTFDQSSADMKFVAAVAGFSMILRDSTHRGTANLNEVARWADAGAKSDPGGYRAEFITLLERAKSLL